MPLNPETQDAIVIREGNKFVALDKNSGGYPYLVDSPWEAQRWNTPALADQYRRKFPSRYQQWRILVFRATQLKDVTEEL